MPSPYTRALRLALLIFVLPGLIFLAVAQFRLVDGDEGFYLLATRLVSEGQTPYRDFFYPQTPLLPYTYAGWSELFGLTWRSARWLSALLAAATSALVYGLARACGTGRRGSLLAVAVFTLSGPTLAWLTVVKTYALSLLCLGSSALLVLLPWRRFELLRLGLAGAAVGCAIGTRLTMALALPALVFGLLAIESPSRRSPTAFAALAVGTACGLLPVAGLMLLDPHRFWFDNLGYHLQGGTGGWPGVLADKLKIALRLAGGRITVGDVGSFHFLIHFLWLGLAWKRGLLDDPRRRFLALIVASLVLGHFVPKHIHVQYFVAVLPFTACIAAFALATPDRSRARRIVLGLTLAGLVLLPLEVFRLTVWGHKVPGVRNHADAVHWRIETIRHVSSELDTRFEPGSLVLSSWPGYLVESRLRALPGTENHFARFGAREIEPQRAAQYRMIGPDEIEAAIRLGRPRVVVLGNWSYDMPVETVLESAGYRLTETLEGTRIYSRPTTR